MATILLVEDDTSMRLLTTAKLKHRYAIISVQDGVEALDVLERQPMDLIIADVMMTPETMIPMVSGALALQRSIMMSSISRSVSRIPTRAMRPTA